MSIDRRRYESSYLPLRTAMERLFEGSFISPQSLYGSGVSAAAFPPADMHVNDNDVVIHMAVPGARPDDINISVTGDAVTISGQVQHRRAEDRQGTSGRRQPYLEEIWSGSFQRSISLPVQVDAGKASADFEHGILTLTLPKSEATRPRKIQVQSRGGASSQSGEGAGGSESGTIAVEGGS